MVKSSIRIQQESANFFCKGPGSLGYFKPLGARPAAPQLLSSAIAAPKNPWAVHEQISEAVFQ